MAFDQFETLDEKIQYVLENHDRLEQARHQKVDKKIKEYGLDIDNIYEFGSHQDLQGLRVIFSNLKHRYKYSSLNIFLERYLNENVKLQSKELGEIVFVFYIASMEEVCNRHSIERPDFIKVEKDSILSVYFTAPGYYAYDKGNIITKERFVSSYEKALPIFKKHNLLIGDIDDVY